MLSKFIAMRMLILSREFTSSISEHKRTLCTLSPYSFDILRAKLVFSLGVVNLCPHPDYYIIVPSIFIEQLSLFSLLFCEVVSVTRLKVCVRIMF